MRAVLNRFRRWRAMRLFKEISALHDAADTIGKIPNCEAAWLRIHNRIKRLKAKFKRI